MDFLGKIKRGKRIFESLCLSFSIVLGSNLYFWMKFKKKRGGGGREDKECGKMDKKIREKKIEGEKRRDSPRAQGMQSKRARRNKD